MLALLIASSGADAKGGETVPPADNMDQVVKQSILVKHGHLSTDDSIGDVLNHPAFAGFASLVLPWDDRTYDADMRLRDIGSLLPYHSHVDPQVVVGALNRREY